MELVAQLVEHLPRMQNVVGLSPAEAAHFSMKMTVLGELHLYCVVLLWESRGLNISCIKSVELV